MAEKHVPYTISPERLAWLKAHPAVLPTWEERVALRKLAELREAKRREAPDQNGP